MATHGWRMNIKKISTNKNALLLCMLASQLIAGSAFAQNTNNTNQNTTKSPEPPKPAPKINIPQLPVNALTPADKNFGGTSIYLIDKKSQQAKDRSIKTPTSKARPVLPSKPAPPKPKDSVIINTGDDASNSKFTPQGHVQNEPDDGFLKPAIYQFYKDSSKYIFKPIGFRPVALESSTSVTLYIIQVDPKRFDFYAFTQDGQSVSTDLLGKGSPIIVGDQGTVVSTGEGILTLHAGNLILDTGNAPIRLGNREAGLKAPANSTVLVEYNPGASMKITCLYCRAGETVKARAAAGANEVSINQGQSLVLDVNGTNIQKVDLQSLASTDALLKSSGYAAAHHGRLQSRIGNLVAKQSADPGLPMRLLAADGSEFYVNEKGALVLNAGWLFVDAPAKSIITSDIGTAMIKKRAFVNVQQVPGYFRIASCSGPDAVTAICDKYKVPLDRGEEVLFTDHPPAAVELAAGDGILRRKLKSAHLSGNYYAALGDFSIYSMLYNAPHLKALRVAGTHNDNEIQKALIRMLAMIQFSTGGRGDYSETPEITGRIAPERFLDPTKSNLISRK